MLALAATMLLPGAFAQQPAEPPPQASPNPAASSSPAAPSAVDPGKFEEKPAPGTQDEPVDRRILGVLPNYRTANPMAVYEPLTTKQKFSIALKDSFDWPNYLVAGAFAGFYQLEDSNPSFGQGLRGYAHRYWTSYIDQSMGNLMTEAVMPTLLREDPRYFRKAQGSKKSRLGYALTRVMITRTDAGGSRFNFSEWIGNGVMASVGNAYYPDARGFSDTMQRLYMEVGTDALSNVLKEFWPDIKHHFHHPESESGAASN